MFETQANSLFHRLAKGTNWALESDNAKVSKWVMKGLITLALPLVGVVGKDLFDAYKKTQPNDELLSRPILAVFPSLKNVVGQGDPLVLWAIMALAVISLGIVVLASLVSIRAWRNTRLAPVPDAKFAFPAPNAKQLLKKLGESPDDYKVVGGVIEIARHPFIVCEPAISGWDCLPSATDTAEVRIEHEFGLDFTVDEALIKGIEPPSGANNKKYSLIETPLDYLDASSKLCLKVHLTDYRTVKQFGEMVRGEQNTTRRHDWGSIFPEDQKIPNSLCLHFLVQLADGSILCMRRRKISDYSQDQISISAEEQFAEIDMHAGPEQAMNHWFRRALCEEIFPLRAKDSGMLERHWKEVKHVVHAMRIFSVFYEEEYANYSLFGYTKLNLDLQDYKAMFERLARSHASGRDKEGCYFLLSKREAITFATTGKGLLQPIWGGKSCLFGDAEAYRPHSSSRYRLLTFLLSVGAINGCEPANNGEKQSARRISKLKADLAQAESDALRVHLAQQAAKS